MVDFGGVIGDGSEARVGWWEIVLVGIEVVDAIKVYASATARFKQNPGNNVCGVCFKFTLGLVGIFVMGVVSEYDFTSLPPKMTVRHLCWLPAEC